MLATQEALPRPLQLFLSVPESSRNLWCACYYLFSCLIFSNHNQSSLGVRKQTSDHYFLGWWEISLKNKKKKAKWQHHKPLTALLNKRNQHSERGRYQCVRCLHNFRHTQPQLDSFPSPIRHELGKCKWTSGLSEVLLTRLMLQGPWPQGRKLREKKPVMQ